MISGYFNSNGVGGENVIPSFETNGQNPPEPQMPELEDVPDNETVQQIPSN